MTRTRLGALAAALAAGLALSACTQAPITGRDQFIMVGEGQAASAGQQAFRQIVSEQRVVTGTAQAKMVNRVGRRIARAAGEDDSGNQWQFVLFDNPEPNAFALPGGKVGVNTGMFKVAKTEDQLAAVMAHEVGHVTARHSAERMSQQAAIQGALGVAATASPTVAQYGQVLAQAATLGVLLPYSRTQESEADRIGLIYMARAGYDPRASIQLWQNMQQVSGGGGGPSFLSTHPGTGDRIANLRQHMPEAMQIYRSTN